MVGEDLGEELLTQMPKEPFFVDFLRDAPELTGEVTKKTKQQSVHLKQMRILLYETAL